MQTRYRVHELSAIWTQIADRAVTLSDSREERRLWIIGLIGVSVIGAWLLFPSIHYLPDVKRDGSTCRCNILRAPRWTSPISRSRSL